MCAWLLGTRERQVLPAVVPTVARSCRDHAMDAHEAERDHRRHAGATYRSDGGGRPDRDRPVGRLHRELGAVDELAVYARSMMALCAPKASRCGVVGRP
jgi:hypothetical protein